MFLSGFTFIRNAIKYDFPIEQAIRSMIPIIDELVICVGRSEDGTEQFVESLCQTLKSEGFLKPIKIIPSVWNDQKVDSGLVLSEQTNIALSAISGKWGLYLQADEAIHEKEAPLILEELKRVDRLNSEQTSSAIEGISYRYLHFYGGYELVQRTKKWYPSEIRIVRNAKHIASFGDAQTFRKSTALNANSDTEFQAKLKTYLSDYHLFHYGHAREPEAMKRKINYFHRFWHGDDHDRSTHSAYQLNLKDMCWYWGTHPKVYEKRQSQDKWSPGKRGEAVVRSLTLNHLGGPQLFLQNFSQPNSQKSLPIYLFWNAGRPQLNWLVALLLKILRIFKPLKTVAICNGKNLHPKLAWLFDDIIWSGHQCQDGFRVEDKELIRSVEKYLSYLIKQTDA